MGNKYFDGKVTNKSVVDEVDNQFIELINTLNAKVEEKMDNYLVSDALTEIFNVLRASNKYIDDTTPWVLAKDEAFKERLETVIYNLLESIRVCAVLLKPFINKTSVEILRQLNNSLESFIYTNDNVYELNQPVVLFQRLDKEKILEEFNIM